MTTEPAKTAMPDADSVRDALLQVIDLEIGMNIIDLGLVYRIEVTDESVRVEMTMTSPACPMGEMIVEDVNTALGAMLPDGLPVEVRLVWAPPWDPSMMSDVGKQHFCW